MMEMEKLFEALDKGYIMLRGPGVERGIMLFFNSKKCLILFFVLTFKFHFWKPTTIKSIGNEFYQRNRKSL